MTTGKAWLLFAVQAMAGFGAPLVSAQELTPPAPDAAVEPAVVNPEELPPDHRAPGDVLPKTLFDFGSVGVTEAPVVSPLMRFPLESGPAFANSQIFMSGGYGYAWTTKIVYPGPEGTQNARQNFDYPWRDNFCEVRRRDAAGCPGGVGHQGQDLRPATCEKGVHWAVAAEDSIVKELGENHMVLLYGLETGQVYVYLHMERPPELGVVVGAKVKKGQRIGKVSNILSATDVTTTHLHFEIWAGGEQDGAAKGVVPLSPYTSLVESYLDLVNSNPDQLAPVALPASARKCNNPDQPG